MSDFRLPTDADADRKPAPPVDKDALRQFAEGARKHRTDEDAPPWEQYMADEVPRYNASVRLNDYQREQLRYLAQIRGMSQQKVLNEILIPAIKELAEAAYRG
jgi:hypothetical protein